MNRRHNRRRHTQKAKSVSKTSIPKVQLRNYVGQVHKDSCGFLVLYLYDPCDDYQDDLYYLYHDGVQGMRCIATSSIPDVLHFPEDGSWYDFIYSGLDTDPLEYWYCTSARKCNDVWTGYYNYIQSYKAPNPFK